jgi:hypothetical protein
VCIYRGMQHNHCRSRVNTHLHMSKHGWPKPPKRMAKGKGSGVELEQMKPQQGLGATTC